MTGLNLKEKGDAPAMAEIADMPGLQAYIERLQQKSRFTWKDALIVGGILGTLATNVFNGGGAWTRLTAAPARVDDVAKALDKNREAADSTYVRKDVLQQQLEPLQKAVDAQGAQLRGVQSTVDQIRGLLEKQTGGGR